MKKIDITSINFDKVVKINDDISSESTIYHDNKMVYKIYKNFSIYELIEREAHVEETSKITNLRVATPLAKLYNGYSFCGCTMAYKKGITLSEYEKTHSIEELKDNWSKRFDKDNLISLCESCHQKVHRKYLSNKEEIQHELKVLIKRYRE